MCNVCYQTCSAQRRNAQSARVKMTLQCSQGKPIIDKFAATQLHCINGTILLFTSGVTWASHPV